MKPSRKEAKGKRHKLAKAKRKTRLKTISKQEVTLEGGVKTVVEIQRAEDEPTREFAFIFCPPWRRKRFICVGVCGNSQVVKTCKNGIVTYIDCTSDPPELHCL